MMPGTVAFGVAVVSVVGLAGSARAQVVQDLSFGTTGLASLGAPSANERWNDVRVLPDGRIIAAGATGIPLLGGPGSMFVARYLASGAVDTGFNGTGSVTLAAASAKSVVVQPDGKILVAGDNSIQTFTDFDGLVISQAPSVPADIVIARLNPNGTLDAGFGSGGLVRGDLSGGRVDTAERLVLFPSGKLWVVGAASSPRGETVTAWSIVAYNADGTLDTGVGSGGRRLIDFGQPTRSASIFDAIPQGDKVILAGTDGTAFIVARVDAAGALDTSFGVGGIARFADTTGLPSATLRARSVAALPDGRLIAHGNFTFFDSDPGIVSPPLAYAVRLTPGGQPDPAFTAFPALGFATSAGPTAAVAGGRVILSVGGSNLIRLNEDGSVDGAFGVGGVLQLRTNRPDGGLLDADNLAVQPSGGLLVAGASLASTGSVPPFQSDAAIVRVNLGAPPACYANCDGSSAAPVLNALDFSCFLSRYQQGQALPTAQQPTAYANCDGSTIVPVLNALDFSCFLTRYIAGCP